MPMRLQYLAVLTIKCLLQCKQIHNFKIRTGPQIWLNFNLKHGHGWGPNVRFVNSLRFAFCCITALLVDTDVLISPNVACKLPTDGSIVRAFNLRLKCRRFNSQTFQFQAITLGLFSRTCASVIKQYKLLTVKRAVELRGGDAPLQLGR